MWQRFGNSWPDYEESRCFLADRKHSRSLFSLLDLCPAELLRFGYAISRFRAERSFGSRSVRNDCCMIRPGICL